MAKVKAASSSGTSPKMRPALTPEARENQMISLAMDLVQQRLIDGTASSQETTHFLKLASSKAILEKERLEEENKLLRAKTKVMENVEDAKVIYSDVLNAIRKYSGQGDVDDNQNLF